VALAMDLALGDAIGDSALKDRHQHGA